LAGLAVKVRELCEHNDDGRADDLADYETLLARGIVADMDRLIG